MIDDEGTAELAAGIADQVTQRVAAARARRERQTTDRATRARRRDAGLTARHAAKTARAIQADAPATSDHQEVTARARQLAASAVSGSMDRRAAGTLVAILGMTKTLTGARKILPEIPLADVRQAVTELLDRLTHEGGQS